MTRGTPVTVSLPSPALRLIRLLRPGGNSLARGVDRFEGVAVGLLVLLALVLLPVMLTFGSLTYEDLAEQQAHQNSGRHETVAVLTGDVVESGAVDGSVTTNGKTPARWRTPDGKVHTGLVYAEDGLTSGAEVPVWVDASGRPGDPPMSGLEIVCAAVLIAVLGWLVAAGSLAVAAVGLRRALDRRRFRAWETEWARVEPDWRQRSR
ncbi:hypothetical protein [Actinophytocola sp.]|uniref:Rv1733c family protein n=1 Tax=Actinophytocola sp. TaxID=1872138 RepID=UPI003899C9B1